MKRLFPLMFAATFVVSGTASAQNPKSASPADVATTLSSARAQIARYQYAPPPSAGDRCLDLKQIVRTLRKAGDSARQAEWHKQMQQVCHAANRPAGL